MHPKTTLDLLAKRYCEIRIFTEALCQPLATEDYVVQSIPYVSPTKWHLAHTSWFFETFLLSKDPSYKPLNPAYSYLFNSYYLQIGKRHCRPKRGLLSRPTVKDIYAYRKHVDKHITELLERASEEKTKEIIPIVEIGLQHGQQHQELILTDIKHVFSANPLRPVYTEPKGSAKSNAVSRIEWIPFKEGLYWIGHRGDGFAFDNEQPRHRVFLNSFQIASRLITNREYMEFIEDGGYRKPELWLSDGWVTVQNKGIDSPLYWEKIDVRWWYFTLSGMQELDHNEPVCHVSYYEADAYARWLGARLPSEQEWEIAAPNPPIQGNFLENGNYQPRSPEMENDKYKPRQMFGDVWEWTQSSYSPYPGFKTLSGALGEYNGKFMCNQMMLRGGSCVTSKSHIRKTYRNFFPPDARWQFSGIRIAKDA